MIRRWIALSLLLLALLTLLPGALAASETQPEVELAQNPYGHSYITVNGTTYSLNLGFQVNGALSTSLFDAICSPDEIYSVDLYVMLADEENNYADAPQSVYDAFWRTYSLTAAVPAADNVQLGEPVQSGYHVKIPATVTGPLPMCDAQLTFAQTADNQPVSVKATLGLNLGLAQALSLENGTAKFSVEDTAAWSFHYYYVDLPASEETLEISAVLDDLALWGTIHQVGMGNSILYKNTESGIHGVSSIQSTASRECFLFRPQADGDFAGTITVRPRGSLYKGDYERGIYRDPDGKEYTIATGIKRNGQIQSNSFIHGITDPQEVIAFDCYVMLQDPQNYADAPRSVYEAFWNQCQAHELILSNGDTAVIGKLTDDTDGYHKYFPVTFTGLYDGFGVLDIRTKTGDDSVMSYCTSHAVLQAEPLTIQDGAVQVTKNNIQPYRWYAFSVDLQNNGQPLQVTASLLNNIQGDIYSQDVIQNYWGNRGTVYSNPRTVTDSPLILLVRTFQSSSFTLSVKAEQEQPQLWYRWMTYDSSVQQFRENPDNVIFPMSARNLYMGNEDSIQLFYGTASDRTLMQNNQVTVENEEILTLKPMRGYDNVPYYELTPKVPGTTNLICQGKTFPITVQPRPRGFYTAPYMEEWNVVDDRIYWYDLPTEEDNRRVVWYLERDGITEQEKAAITVCIDEQELDTIQWVPREGTDCYNLKILLPETANYGYMLEIRLNNNRRFAFYVSMEIRSMIGEVGDLFIGFTETDPDTDITVLLENGHLYGYGTDKDRPTGYIEPETLTISAVRKRTEGTSTVYDLDSAVTESLKITNVQIIPYRGEPSVFSLSNTQCLQQQTDLDGNTFTFYHKEGFTSHAAIRATVTGQVGSEPFTVTVQGTVQLNRMALSMLQRPEGDTVEALNADLLALAAEAVVSEEQSNLYDIRLANTVYEGTIVIPARISDKCTFHLDGSGSTIIRGGIDLNRGQTLEHVTDLHFMAPEAAEDEITRAIWGGDVAILYDCSFQGYDVAVDCSDGLINLSAGQIKDHTGNVFADNEVAVRLDLGEQPSDHFYNWSGNTFLRNGTAIEVLSLQSAPNPEYGNLSPYYFRIIDSNFIGNDLDFDMQHAGRYYMYRNYYAKVHPNNAKTMTTEALYAAIQAAQTDKATHQLVTSNSPEIRRADNKTKVITNPRWKYPVRDALSTKLPSAASSVQLLSDEQPYENCLIIDWSQETEILTGMSDDLPVAAEAFAVNGEKTVDVLQDQTEALLGTWTFPEQAAGLVLQQEQTADFHAGLTVTREREAITVTVEDNGVLAQYSPTLTIPDAGKVLSVTLDQQPVSFTTEDGAVTFPVTKGGSYVIEIAAPDDVTAEAEAVPDPQTPGKVLVPVSLQSNALTEKICTVIVSAYDENRQMQDVAVSDVITLQPGQTDSCTLSLTDCPADAVIRVFVVDGNSAPLTTVPPIS